MTFGSLELCAATLALDLRAIVLVTAVAAVVVSVTAELQAHTAGVLTLELPFAARGRLCVCNQNYIKR
jgi:hypothetical protein